MPWSSTRRDTNPKYRTAEHRAARARLLAAFRPGDPCCLCGRAMYPPTRNLHADHCPACRGRGCSQCNDTGYRGLAHGGPPYYCNQRDGSRRARARQESSRLKW